MLYTGSTLSCTLKVRPTPQGVSPAKAALQKCLWQGIHNIWFVTSQFIHGLYHSHTLRKSELYLALAITRIHTCMYTYAHVAVQNNVIISFVGHHLVTKVFQWQANCRLPEGNGGVAVGSTYKDSRDVAGYSLAPIMFQFKQHAYQSQLQLKFI